MANNVWFTADLHLKHKNILHHQKNRLIKMNLKDENDIEGHDEYIINMWLEQTDRNDHIYVLGDLILANKEQSLKILNKLKANGRKIHLIVGNHDKSTKTMYNMFESIEIISVHEFKPSQFPFIQEDKFQIVMCHYPMKSWPHKTQGAFHLYGHVHNNSPWMDEDTNDLCFNVGLDNPICDYKLISLENLYHIYKEKLKGFKPKHYSDEICKTDKKYIR